MKKSAITIVVVFILQITIRGNENLYLSFESIESLLMPYNLTTQSVDFYTLTLNVGLVLVCLFNLISRADEVFKIQAYVIVRNGTFELTRLFFERIFKVIVMLLLAKVIVDIVFTMQSLTENSVKLIQILLSIFITLLIWASTIYLMKLMYMKINNVYFILLFIIICSQVMSLYNKFFSIYVFATYDFYNDYIFIVLGKVSILLIICFAIIIRQKKYECIGEE